MNETNPWQEIRKKHDEIHKLFNDFFTLGWSKKNQDQYLPNLREKSTEEIRQTFGIPITVENDNAISITMALPGIEPKDLHLSVLQQGIEIRAQKIQEIKSMNEGILAAERSTQEFLRFIPSSFPLEPKAVHADLKEGVLHIHIPKIKERRELP